VTRAALRSGCDHSHQRRSTVRPPGLRDLPQAHPARQAADHHPRRRARARHPAKTKLTKTPLGWGHTACSPRPLAEAEYVRNKAAVESGETYRSQAPSTWRRKGSPSTYG